MLVLLQLLATLQAVRAGSFAAAHPPVGQLLAPRTLPYRLRLQCVGDTNALPTVVLDAGMGLSGITYAALLGNVSAFARTCLYDRCATPPGAADGIRRAGYGWSDSGALPRSAAQFAFELRGLLDAAGLLP